MPVELSLLEGYKECENSSSLLSEYSIILNMLQQYSEDMFVVLNKKKHVIMSSKSFSSFMGRENIIGESFYTLMSNITLLPEDFFKEECYFIKVTQNTCERVLEARIKNFKEIYTGQPKRYIVILKDISEQTEIQAQKDTFVATLTHDLKTPVRAGILSLELLLKGHFGTLNEQQTEIIREILNSNQFMMNMLDTLLAKYKYESEGVILVKNRFNLNEFITSVTQDLKYLFNEKNLTYNLCFEEDNLEIYGDKLELKRALSNIICNAIKFNKQNGFVRISTFCDKDYINIKIEDNGIGMKKETVKHVFDKYVSYAKRFRRLGTGLGLYVAKKIIDAHEGIIDIESTYNKGSVFTVKLPKIDD